MHLYTEAALPTVERQLTLEATYGFVCTCLRCASPQPAIDLWFRSDKHGKPAPALRVLNQLDHDAPDNDTTGQLRRARDLLDLLPGLQKADEEYAIQAQVVAILENVLHPLSLDLYSQRAELFSLALEENNLQTAIEVGSKLIAFLEAAYNHIPYHPMLGIQYHTVGDLCLELGLRPKAHEKLQRAREILAVAYGTTHPLVRGLDERLRMP